MYLSCLAPHDVGGGTVVRTISSTQLREREIKTVVEQVLSVVRRERPSTLLLDFRNVEFLTAAVLGELVDLHTTLQDAGKHLVLTNLSAQLVEVFEVTRLDSVLDIRPAGGWQETARQFSA